MNNFGFSSIKMGTCEKENEIEKVNIINYSGSYTHTLKFELIQDIQTAERYWKHFSPNESLFDNWEFRYCAYKYLQYNLFFYVGFLNEEPIGLLPLEWNPQKLSLEFFGGWYMEANKVFIKAGYEQFIHEFYRIIQKPFELKYISSEFPQNENFQHCDFSYFVETGNLTSFEDFVDLKFAGKKKNEFKRVVKNLYKNPSLKIIENRFSDISTMFEYSLKNFEDKCDHLINPQESKFELDLINEFDAVMLSFCFDDKVQAVSLLIEFNGILYGINGGINYSEVNNLGKLVFAEKVNYAIRNKLQMYHAGVGSYNWKEDWHLDKTKMYEFKK